MSGVPKAYMAQAQISLTKTNNIGPNRVVYQGIIYTICTSCYEIIGSGRAEASLLAIEQSHHCPAMSSGIDKYK
jgi:hypothetical protein